VPLNREGLDFFESAIAGKAGAPLVSSETVDGRRLQKFVPMGKVSKGDTQNYLGSPHYEPFPERR
jgi:hypothetical protein